LSHANIYAVGVSNTLLRYDGVAWTPHPASVQLPAGNDLFAVWASAPNDLYVAGQNVGPSGPTGVAFHYDGSVLAAVPIGAVNAQPKMFRGIVGVGGVVYAPAVSTAVLSTYAVPATLSMCQGVSANPWGIAANRSGQVVVACELHRFFPLNTGCNPSAAAYDIGGTADFFGVAGVEDDFYLVGTAGLVGHWSTTTAYAPEATPPIGSDLYAIWGATQADIYAVGANGIVLHRH
jgi:hypothetical protein